MLIISKTKTFNIFFATKKNLDYSGWARPKIVSQSRSEDNKITSLKSNQMETDSRSNNSPQENASISKILFDEFASQPQKIIHLLNLFGEDHRNKLKVFWEATRVEFF